MSSMHGRLGITRSSARRLAAALPAALPAPGLAATWDSMTGYGEEAHRSYAQASGTVYRIQAPRLPVLACSVESGDDHAA